MERTADLIARIRDRPDLGYALAVAGPGVATVLGLLIGEARTAAAAMVYLLVVLAAAVAGGRGPGLVSSVLSFVGLNYFFTPPRRLLSVDKTDDLVALMVFLVVGFVVSALVNLGATERRRAERREREATSLYASSTRFGGADVDAALQDLVDDATRLFGLDRCEVLVRGDGSALVPRARAGDHAGLGPPVELPLATTAGDVGVMRLIPGARGFDEQDRRIAVILARQAASAVAVGMLAEQARAAEHAAETDRIRRALLSAVSHDFRTPLASIKAAITALQGASMSEAEAKELLDTAAEETSRLERLVTNLLDLTRIRSGAIAPERVPIAVQDLLDEAIASLRAPLSGHELTVSVKPDVPLLDVDPVQVGQVLHNVLENAAKFAPSGTPITVTVSPWHGSVEVRVADRGPGIAADEREAVFEEFYRTGDKRTAGTGLGLAVARAIVRAHEGDVWIEGSPGGGTTVVVRLPAVRGGTA